MSHPVTYSLFAQRSGTLGQPQRAERNTRAGSAAVIDLPAHTLIALPAGPARQIFCVAGTLWVTEDASCSDIVLHPGEQHRTSGAARVVIVALESSTYRAMNVARTSFSLARAGARLRKLLLGSRHPNALASRELTSV